MKKYRFYDLSVFFGYLFLSFIYFYRYMSSKIMLYGSDWLLGSYANRVWMTNFIKKFHHLAFWSPYVSSGNLTVGTFFGDIMTPSMLIRFLLPTHIVYVLTYIFIIAIACFGTYLFLKNIGLKKYFAILGGLLYGWSGVIVSTTQGGHLNRTVSAALFPMVFYLIFMGLKSKRVRYFILAGGTGGLSLLMGHFQMAYYYIPTILAFVVWYLITNRTDFHKKEFVKIISYLIFTIIISGLMYSFYIFPVKMNLPYTARGTSRGYAYATSWSMPPEETFDLFNPHFSGVLNNYWGRNYFKLHTEFTGIFLILLFFGGLIFERKRGLVKFFIWIFGLTLLFAWGGHTFVYRIYYYLIPGIQKFRAPAMIFYQTVFAMVVIGAIFLNNFKWDKKRIYYLFGFIGFIVLLALIFSVGRSGIESNLSRFISFKLKYAYGRDLIQAKLQNIYKNYPLLMAGFWISFLFSLIYSGLILFSTKNKKYKEWIIAVMGLVFLVEMWPVEKKFLKAVPGPRVLYAPDEVVNFLKKDNSIYRIFPLRYEHDKDGLLVLNGIQNIGGYSPNPLKIYQEYIGAGKSVMFQPKKLIYNPKLIDLLNVKYLIDKPLPEDISRYSKNVQQEIIQWRNFLARFEEIYRDNNYVIFNNPFAVPRAYLVHKYIVNKNYNDVLNRVAKSEFSPLDSCFIDGTPSYKADNKIIPDYKLHFSSYTPNRMIVNISTNTPGILVFSENWHPAWIAIVDGKKVRVYRTNFLFRGIEIPRGNHKVEMVYNGKEERKGIVLSFIGYVIFLLGFFIPNKKRER